ncbi:Signal transduction histidine kinase [Amphibacillus marinus]|uniref:histidine kinase n=1 Tax=Amphibacillus marinus TaxID=872970 RepID=A0A1H8K3T2_9BACI|nr:histidine kinase [Amphibacillus marinus]SEN87603.1 Signal transduction histidine kinase [Amphibacillus marinus]
MLSYWFSMIYLLLTWSLALFIHTHGQLNHPIPILLSAVFFIIYFFLPLVKGRSYLCSLYLLSAIVYLTYWPSIPNPFMLLIILVIVKEAMNRLKGMKLYLFLIVQVIASLSPYLWTGEYLAGSYTLLLISYVTFLFLVWFRISVSLRSLTQTYDETNSQYRRMKRRVVDHEQAIRQEERNQIAREIHDSVGHRLTALLMQLEVARIKAEDHLSKAKFEHLKALAQASLDETREAVKALKSEETTGLAAVIQLIRKLESESHLRVAFIVNPGALSVPLSNNQSVTVYRSVQEALTNMMRHSQVRKGQIEFSLIGEQFFRFTVSHQLNKKAELNEGFGLTAMRDRLKQLGGNLVITQVDAIFKISGTFPIEKVV